MGLSCYFLRSGLWTIKIIGDGKREIMNVAVVIKNHPRIAWSYLVKSRKAARAVSCVMLLRGQPRSAVASKVTGICYLCLCRF